MISFRLAADADQFLTIAKFRALRKLWARVEEACGLAPRPVFVAAETAWRMMTRRDPWVNMLRTTVAVFAAGSAAPTQSPCCRSPPRSACPTASRAGSPATPSSSCSKNPTSPRSPIRRQAPAASRTLTTKLCAAAWSLFQDIERAGGAWGALEQGLIQNKVAAVRAERESAVAKGRDALTGTSAFPDIHEAPVAVLDVAPVAPLPVSDAAVKAEPLVRMRLAEPFETLRDASDRMLAQTGARPKIFLANLGPIAAFTARAMFAKNFFEAGGIEAVTNDGFAFLHLSPLGRGRPRSGRVRGNRIHWEALTPHPTSFRSVDLSLKER